MAYTEAAQIPDSSTGVHEGGSNRKQRTRVQIRVDSKVRDIEHGETKPTGQFNYTFLVDREIRVVPQTYSEFMIWVDARRRAGRARESLTNIGVGDGGGVTE